MIFFNRGHYKVTPMNMQSLTALSLVFLYNILIWLQLRYNQVVYLLAFETQLAI